MRKLATIQSIKELQPIPNAEAIERATILGWQVVVKKGEFKVGDLCVYCEIDSVLPEKPEFEFLRARKFRIKTVKLRGQVSQGIAFPISILYSESALREIPRSEIKEGLDVTEILGIIKYEPPPSVMTSGKIKGAFPGYIAKSDQTRIQSVPEVLTRPENVGKRCFITEKVDGTSATYYYHDGQFGVCSRNLELLETENNIYWMVARQYQIENVLKTLGKNIAIQGEILGPKIQNNLYKLRKHKLALFDVFDVDRHGYLNYTELIEFVQKLNHVSGSLIEKATPGSEETEPIVFELVPVLRDDYILGKDEVPGLVAMSEGKSVLNPETDREGLVIKPLIESSDPELGRLTFKIVNPQFLLKYEE